MTKYSPITHTHFTHVGDIADRVVQELSRSLNGPVASGDWGTGSALYESADLCPSAPAVIGLLVITRPRSTRWWLWTL